MSDIQNKKGVRALPKDHRCGCSHCIKCTGVGRDRRNRKTERHRTQQEYLRERFEGMANTFRDYVLRGQVR